MIAHFFEISGIDQILAPRKVVEKSEEFVITNNDNDDDCRLNHENESDFWEFVAPRRRQSGCEATAMVSKSTTTMTVSADAITAEEGSIGGVIANSSAHVEVAGAAAAVPPSPRLVKCQHCHQWTPASSVDGAIEKEAEMTKLQLFTPRPKSPSCLIPPPTTTINDEIIIDRNHDNETEIMNDQYTYHHEQEANNDVDNDEEQLREEEKAILHERILQAAHETAITSSGPTFHWEDKHNLFALCSALPKNTTANTKKTARQDQEEEGGCTKNQPKRSKNVKKLHKLLSTKSHRLLLARSANMWSTLGLPDGYTILHAACHVGNTEVVEYLLLHHVTVGDGGGGGGGDGVNKVVMGEKKDTDSEEDRSAIHSDSLDANNEVSRRETDNERDFFERIKLDLNEVDMQGRTALHIAAEWGHIEVILLLKAAYDKSMEHQQQQQQQQLELSKLDNRGEESIGVRDDHDPSTSSSSKTTPPITTTPLTIRTPQTPLSSHIPGLTSSSNRATNVSLPHFSFRSPPPSSSSSSMKITPTFAGPRAPIDLSGRTPLGYAATSPVPKARLNRSALEKVLYVPGDRSIVGHGGCAERTPPRARCGPSPPTTCSLSSSLLFLSPTNISGTTSTATGIGSSARYGGRTPPPPNSTYLSPTPHGGSIGRSFMNHNNNYTIDHNIATSGRRPGSALSTTSRYATPFQSPPTIIEEEVIHEDDCLGAKFEDSCTLQKKNNDCLHWGASEMNGWRIDMEDKILVKYEVYGTEDPPHRPPHLNTDRIHRSSSTIVEDAIVSMGLFGVFDGHGDGGYASNFLASNLWNKLQSQPDWPAVYHGCNDESYTELFSRVFTQACYDLDEDLRKDKTKPSRDGGSTAITALICNRYLYVANVGDSRCILVRKKKMTIIENETVDDDATFARERNENSCAILSEIEVIPMSEDHKPNLPEERARIESAGLAVQSDYVPSDKGDGQTVAIHRVKKSDTELLGVARAFGDYDFKSKMELSANRQAVICTPDIVVRERAIEEDMYLILACDGIWDVMSNDDVGKLVARRVSERLRNDHVQGEILARVGDDLLAYCLESGSRDNMSVLIVSFPASGLYSTSLPMAQNEISKGDVTLPYVSDVTVRTLAYE